MAQPQPNNFQEYNDRFQRNNRVEGFGLETTCVVPCPFCAAPDWKRWRVLEVERDSQIAAECKECGRSAKSIVQRNANGVAFEVVQTGGPDQPDWLQPKMRRVP